MTQVLNVWSPVPRFLSSLRFPDYIDRNWDHMLGERLRVKDLGITKANISEVSKSVRAYMLHSLPLLSLYAPAGRWLSYGSSISNLWNHVTLLIRGSTHFEDKWGAFKSLVELVSTCYRLKAGLALHAAMDCGESVYHYTQNGDLQELLPAVSSGLYLTTFLPMIPKKVRDIFVCISLTYQAGFHFYRSYLHQKAIEKEATPTSAVDDKNKTYGRNYYGMMTKLIVGGFRLYQAGRLGWRLIQEETPVQRTIIIMRPASQKDPKTGGLTEKGQAFAEAIAKDVDRVAAEHGGKPVIYVSPLKNSEETGNIIGRSLKRPKGITQSCGLTERFKIGILGERQDELANRLDGAVQEILGKTEAKEIPLVITHGDIAKKYVDELRDVGVDISEVFKRRLHTGEMIVLRRTGDEVVLVERVRPSKPSSSSAPASEKKAGC